MAKERYRRDLMFAPDAVGETSFISHTTGTTGELTWRHRSMAEAAIIAELFQPKTTAPGPLTLAIRTNRHGMGMPVPGTGRVMPASLTDTTELHQCLTMATITYRFAGAASRVRGLAGGGMDVALLVSEAIERQASLDSITHLDLGGFIDERMRSSLLNALALTSLVEVYSQAEVFGGAVRRWPDPDYVLQPAVIGEVVDATGSHVGQDEVGELVLTELFPFVQMQPLIRYRTGDLVRRISPPTDDALRFRWLGRWSHCLDRGDGRPMFAYSEIADWFSLREEVALDVHKPELQRRGPAVGRSAFTIEPDDVRSGSVVVRVTAADPTRTAGDLHEQLGQDLWDALRARTVHGTEGIVVQLEYTGTDDPSSGRRCASTPLTVAQVPILDPDGGP